MVNLNVIRSVAVAGVALALSVATANATAIIYATDAATLEAPGTIASGGTGDGGGLCTLDVSSCPNPTLNGNQAAGTLTNGLIVFSASTSGIADYRINIGITGLTADGSVWDVTLVNTTNNTGYSLGLTSIVNTSTNGSGSLSVIVSGNGTFAIGITDLLEQYATGATDKIPGLGGGPYTVSGSYNANSEFSLTASATNVPEPASMALFVGSLSVLGALRRRRGR